MDCSCDYDPPSVYHKRIHHARKEHRCSECRRRIRVGERYEYVFGVWGGDRGIFRTCLDCCDIRMFVKNSVPCFCWSHGNLIEDCRDTIEYAYDRAASEVRGLAFGFGRLLVKAKRAEKARAT